MPASLSTNWAKAKSHGEAWWRYSAKRAWNLISHFQPTPVRGLSLFIARDAATDIYFVSNQRQRFESLNCSFRVAGKTPELWHPDTGVIERAPVWREENGRTIVPLQLDPAGSVFVVFRQEPPGDQIVSAEWQGPSADKAENSPKLQIIKAEYGAFGGDNTTGTNSQTVDVTKQLADQVTDNQIHVDIGNDLAGDPAFGMVKQLRVEYSLGGVTNHAEIKEGDTLNLPDNLGPLGAPPKFEVVAGENGQAIVRAFAPGQVQMQTASGKTLSVNAADLQPPLAITGDWQLDFPPNWGAPPSVVLNQLISWTEHTNSGVRYFSGTATYEKEIEIPADMFGADREIWLDLGAVKNFAEVSLNGKSFPVLWKPPFRLNLTGAAQPGANQLEIKVTNLWPNRLIGDEQLPDDREWSGKHLKAWPQWVLDGKPSPTGRFTFTTWHHWTKDDSLLPSGLLGPVMLEPVLLMPANAVSVQ